MPHLNLISWVDRSNGYGLKQLRRNSKFILEYTNCIDIKLVSGPVHRHIYGTRYSSMIVIDCQAHIDQCWIESVLYGFVQPILILKDGVPNIKMIILLPFELESEDLDGGANRKGR